MQKPIEAIQDAHGVDAVQAEDAVTYLRHYGYIAGALLSAPLSPMAAVTSLAAALSEFQRIAGLPVTGMLDDATRDKMTQPRCGCLDVQRMVEFARWRKNKINYFVQDYVSNLSKTDQDSIIRLAWNQWQDVADIQLTQTTSPSNADIVISTGRGRGDQFDGPSGTLAWAYLPNGNDQQLLMKFDLDESWGKDTGIRMLNVACHEFGHLLGLEHSQVSSALMAPFYSPGISKPQPNDDIPRIQALYGAAGGTTPPPVTPQTYRLTMDFPGPPTGFLLKGPISYTLVRKDP